MTKTVAVTTALPISADAACALAKKAAMIEHVLWPWVRMAPDEPLPESVGPDDEIATRLWLFGVLPGWTHTLRVVRIDAHELATRERGGPVSAWNHTLSFVPAPGGGCHYTDRIEIAAGPLTPLVVLIARVLFRYRQARWRRLTRIVA